MTNLIDCLLIIPHRDARNAAGYIRQTGSMGLMNIFVTAVGTVPTMTVPQP